MNLRRDIFQVKADSIRGAILFLIALQSLTAGVIAAKFGTTRSTVYKTLKIN